MDSSAKETLFSIAKRDWSSPQRNEVETALAEERDWSGWLQLARHYRLSQLIYFNLRHQDLLEKLPAPVQQELKQDYLQTHSLNLAYYTELKKILALFQANSINCLVLKGAALAPSLYHDLGLRSFVDVDLLIRPTDLEKAHALLEGLYQPQVELPSSALARRCHFHRAYQRCLAPHLSLELHWRLFSSTTVLELDLNPFWQETQALTAVDCQFLAPRREYLFIHQCLHFSGHYFLSWRDLVDIDWFLSPEEPPLDWDFILEVAKRHYLRTRLFYPLWWAAQLLQVELPLQVLDALEPDLPKQQLFQQIFRREGGILSEPAGRNKDLRVVIDLMLLAQHQVLDFFRRLCWPGIAWLTVFPDQPAQMWPLRALRVFLRGLRLIFYVCWYLLRV